MGDKGQVWVKVRASEMLWMKWGNRGFVGFQDGRLLITYPQSVGKPVTMLVKVKGVLRNDPVTIRVDSGFWGYGYVTLTFDSKEDADRVEPELLRLSQSRSSRR